MCEYTAKYYDYESKKFANYKCPHPPKVDGYCIFHAEDYWRYHKDEVRNEFYKLVEDAIINEKPLFCIGFNLPSFDLNALTEKDLKIEFKKPVYFDGAKFQAVAYFRDATFSKAYFLGAKFQAVAYFRGATFQAEAYFSGAKFFEAYFRGATFQAEAYFRDAKFQAEADFRYAKFFGATFSNADFKDEVEFVNTKFYPYLLRWNNKSKEYDISNLKELYGISEDAKVEQDSKTIMIEDNSRKIIIDIEKKKMIINDKEIELMIKDDMVKVNDIPIKFDYSTFRKRVRFIGGANDPLSLEAVSFKGVDLTNVEFHNVKWNEKKEFFGLIKRKAIIDEEFMDKVNYEEVLKIYNQLRKNYETRLLFNEASNFFIGEMEAIRKSHGKLKGIIYLFYKYIAMYGENYLLPLLWTLLTIIGFTFLRIDGNMPELNINIDMIINNGTISGKADIIQRNIGNNVNIYNKFFDSFRDSLAAYFQIPRSNQLIDIIERIIAAPILGTAFIALKRKFERRK